MPPKPTPPPNQWATGDPWHAHPLRADAPPYAHVAQHAAATIHAQLTETGTSLRTAASQAGVDHGTLSRVLAGNTVPDIATLAALADALELDIWPPRP